MALGWSGLGPALASRSRGRYDDFELIDRVADDHGAAGAADEGLDLMDQPAGGDAAPCGMVARSPPATARIRADRSLPPSSGGTIGGLAIGQRAHIRGVPAIRQPWRISGRRISPSLTGTAADSSSPVFSFLPVRRTTRAPAVRTIHPSPAGDFRLIISRGEDVLVAFSEQSLDVVCRTCPP